MTTFTEKIFFTYRQMFTNRNCRYDISFYNDAQYSDYIDAGLTEMTDGDKFIPEARITKELVPGIKHLRKAGVLKHNVPPLNEELKASLLNIATPFAIELKTKEEMITWVKDNTDLVEDTPGKFLIQEADGEELLENKYLIID